MTNLIERLKSGNYTDAVDEAIEEIEALRAKVAQLEKTLTMYREYVPMVEKLRDEYKAKAEAAGKH